MTFKIDKLRQGAPPATPQSPQVLVPGHGTCAEADSVTRATGAAVSHLGRRVLLGRGNELRHGPRKGRMSESQDF